MNIETAPNIDMFLQQHDTYTDDDGHYFVNDDDNSDDNTLIVDNNAINNNNAAQNNNQNAVPNGATLSRTPRTLLELWLRWGSNPLQNERGNQYQ